MSWTVILACFALTRLTGVCSCTETGLLQLSLPSLHLSLFPPALISGWWYVEDLHGRSGWAPASFLKPVLDKGHQRNGDVVGKCPGWRQLEIELHSLVQPRSQVRRRGRRLGLVQLNYNLSSSKTFVPKINIKILFSPNSECFEVCVVFRKRGMKTVYPNCRKIPKLSSICPSPSSHTQDRPLKCYSSTMHNSKMSSACRRERRWWLSCRLMMDGG